jgi:hypothetical protein
VTKTQHYRKELAEQGIECTIDEVRKLVKVAKRIREMTLFSVKELMGIFDLKDEKQRTMFEVIINLKCK